MFFYLLPNSFVSKGFSIRLTPPTLLGSTSRAPTRSPRRYCPRAERKVHPHYLVTGKQYAIQWGSSRVTCIKDSEHFDWSEMFAYDIDSSNHPNGTEPIIPTLVGP